MQNEKLAELIAERKHLYAEAMRRTAARLGRFSDHELMDMLNVGSVLAAFTGDEKEAGKVLVKAIKKLPPDKILAFGSAALAAIGTELEVRATARGE
jgi:hypothetical protein